MVNIDVIPLFNDSRTNTAYPILIKVCSTVPKIFCAGLYLSHLKENNKMPPVNDFLNSFVIELKELIEEGICVNNVNMKFEIAAFVCDSPARSDLKKKITMAMNHVNAVRNTGLIKLGMLYFQILIVLKELIDQFLSKAVPDHHKEGPLSILHKLGIGMVSSISLDVMH